MTTAQHQRLKNEQEWILSAGGADQLENGWSESTAQLIAAQSGIQLSEAHWEVIRYVRDYYSERGFVRRSRELSSALNASTACSTAARCSRPADWPVFRYLKIASIPRSGPLSKPLQEILAPLAENHR